MNTSITVSVFDFFFVKIIFILKYKGGFKEESFSLMY